MVQWKGYIRYTIYYYNTYSDYDQMIFILSLHTKHSIAASSPACRHLCKVSELEKAGGRSLTGRQQSVAFHHLGCTGISTTWAPDLDTSLAINGFRFATCQSGRDKRWSTRLEAGMIAGTSLSTLTPSLFCVSQSVSHNMDKVTPLWFWQLTIALQTKSLFQKRTSNSAWALIWSVGVIVEVSLSS